MRKTPALVVAVVAVGTMTVLSGCALADLGRHQRESAFANTAAVADTWGKSAPWLPADATEIKTVEATDNDDAVLLATSSSDLDPAVCAEVDRDSAAIYSRDWTPNPYAAERAWACGDWTVIAAEGGWYGWTPGSAEEKAQSPSR